MKLSTRPYFLPIGALLILAAITIWNSKGTKNHLAVDSAYSEASGHNCEGCHSAGDEPENPHLLLAKSEIPNENVSQQILSDPDQGEAGALGKNQILNFYRYSHAYALDSGPLESLKHAVVGERVVLYIPGFELGGVVDSVSREGVLNTVGVTLDNAMGRAVYLMRADGRLRGQIFFDGEAEALRFQGESPDEWIIEKASVSQILCSPRGATYPLDGNILSANYAGDTSRQISNNTAAFQQLALSSLPDATYCIYIDFDGESVTHPSWNGGTTVIAAPHAQAANDSWVTVIWQRVAEDFAPFNINVTTDRFVYNNTDNDKRVMCVVTPTRTVAPGSGGVAYVGSFGNDVPCWAFNAAEYACADTISHEVGHTLSLLHDGQAGDADQYFDGHGSGETAWGAIMGASFQGEDENVTQWSKGEYSDAVQYDSSGNEIPPYQDDVALIGSTGTSGNGFGFRNDDVGNSISAAEALSMRGSVVNDSGIIETVGDLDVYVFSTLGGDVTLNVNPLDVDSREGESGSETMGANLAVSIALQDAAGTQIAAVNPTSTLGATIQQNLAEGTYHLVVGADGRGNPLSDGFSNYASLGQYFVTGLVPTTPLEVKGGSAQRTLIANGDLNPSLADGTDYDLNHIGSTGVTHYFAFQNTGTEQMVINSISFGNNAFSSDATLPLTLEAQEIVNIGIRFNPTNLGLFESQVTASFYTTNDSSRVFTHTFALRGAGTKSIDDDNYEENDNFFTAYNIPQSTALAGILGSGKQSDNDWYIMNVPAGLNSIEVTCTFDHSLGDINLALYNPKGYFITETSGTQDVETLTRVVDPAGGNYALLVKGANNKNLYDFSWESKAPLITAPIDEDSYETNNTFFTAYDLSSLDGGVQLEDLDGPGIQKDNDWYKLVIDPNETALSVNLQKTGEDLGAINLKLYDHRGYVVASTEDEGWLYFNGPIGQTTYYLLVRGDNSGQSYSFFYNNSAITTPPDDGTDDNYEENDNLFKAYDFSSGEGVLLSTIDGAAKQRDLDWYKLESSAGENVIRVSFAITNPASRGLSAALYDYRGYRKAELDMVEDGTGLSLRASNSNEAAYLLIKGDNTGDLYDFSWESFFLEEGEDLFEENDTRQTAYNLSGQEARLLTAIAEFATQTDQDWYKIKTSEGDAAIQVKASLLEVGSIDVVLFEEDGTRINSMTVDTSDFQTLEISATASTTYYILVEGSNLGLRYDLSWEARPNFQDDAYEENDSSREAYQLPSTLTGKLSDLEGLAVQSDYDWYKIDTPAEAFFLTLNLSFTHSEGDLDIVVYDQEFNLLASSLGVGDSERIAIPVNNTTYKTIYIWVYSLGTARGNTYDLEWTYSSISGGDTDSDRISDTWENKHSASLGTIKAFSNVDGDDMPAWAEFAFNTDPTKADDVEIDVFIEDGYACFMYKRNKDAANSGYQYSVSESEHITFAQSPSEPRLLRIVDKGDYEEVVYRSAQPLSNRSKSFFKVKVEPPE